jgi:hypothetical protein
MTLTPSVQIPPGGAVTTLRVSLAIPTPSARRCVSASISTMNGPAATSASRIRVRTCDVFVIRSSLNGPATLTAA